MRSRHRHRSWEIKFDAKVKDVIQRGSRDPSPLTAQVLLEAFISLTSTYPIMARFLFLEDAFMRITGAGSVPVPPINLGTAANYAILAQAGIAGAPGSNTITGNIAVSPIDHTAITGFPLTPPDASAAFSTTPQVIGDVYAADYQPPTPATLTVAVVDMQAAYTAGNALPPSSVNLNGGNIGGLNLAPGVYKWTTGVTIAGADLTLTGSPTDVWVFQVTGALALAAARNIILAGGAVASNVFWVVTGTTSTGVGSTFNGNILDATNIQIGSTGTVNGRLLSQTQVALQGSTIINQ
jgi:hypothetical protein